MKISLMKKEIWGYLIAVCCLLILGSIGLKIIQACNSAPQKLALQVLEQIPAVTQRLGSPALKVCYRGHYFEEGDYGLASYRIYLRGAIDSGTYKVRLMKSKNNWFLIQGRVDFYNSEPMEVRKDDHLTPYVLPIKDNDEPLPADRSAVAAWRPVEWPGKGISLQFELPSDTTTSKFNSEEIQFNFLDGSYFIARVTPIHNPNEAFWVPGFRRLSGIEHRQYLQKSRVKYDARRYRNGNAPRGSTFKEIAQIRGVMDWPNPEVKLISWRGYFQSQEHGPLELTLLLGARSRESFHASKPIFGAILETIKRREL